MKTLIILFLALLAFGCTSTPPDTPLYPIQQGDRWGFIDTNGTVMIQTRFRSVSTFSEGLAAARLDGNYGYIDASGRFVLTPKYDYALPFIEGRAKVYINGQAFFIDKKGRVLFRHPYREIEEFGVHTYAIATTYSGRMGLIDREGGLIADTIFAEIGEFAHGVVSVTGMHHQPYGKVRTHEAGVIDTTGKWIVPFGVYAEIDDFTHHRARVELLPEKRTKDTPYWGIIDTKGKWCFALQNSWSSHYHRHDNSSDNFIIISIARPRADSSGYTDDYKGLVNSTGRLVSDTSWTELIAFSRDRLFVQIQDRYEWRLIDTEGKRVSDKLFYSVFASAKHRSPWQTLHALFQDGRAVVRMEGGYAVIDTAGNFVIPPRIFDFGVVHRLSRNGDLVVLHTQNKSVIWNIRTNTFLPPTSAFIDIDRVGDTIFPLLKDGRKGYMNHRGTIVWRGSSKQDKLLAYNIDYMTRGFCSVPLDARTRLSGFEEWKGGDNAKAVLSGIPVSGRRLQMVIDPSKQTTVEHRHYEKRYRGMALYLVNAGADTMYFAAEECGLPLLMQAKDYKGEWRDIEYVPEGGCGFGRYTAFLSSGKYWKFAVPAYEGGYVTKVRAKLLYKQHSDREAKELILYSNEVVGSINPAQFWRDRVMYSRDVMHPGNYY